MRFGGGLRALEAATAIISYLGTDSYTRVKKLSCISLSSWARSDVFRTLRSHLVLMESNVDVADHVGQVFVVRLKFPSVEE